MKLFTTLIMSLAAAATTAACTTCYDCPGSQVCNHFGGFGAQPADYCVEPEDVVCNDPRSNCDTLTCE